MYNKYISLKSCFSTFSSVFQPLSALFRSPSALPSLFACHSLFLWWKMTMRLNKAISKRSKCFSATFTVFCFSTLKCFFSLQICFKLQNFRGAEGLFSQSLSNIWRFLEKFQKVDHIKMREKNSGFEKYFDKLCKMKKNLRSITLRRKKELFDLLNLSKIFKLIKKGGFG